jgi:hypothetical protein
MTNNANEALTVTQTDRDAAADFYGKYLARPGEVPVEAAFRFGQVDESPLIQAFARHRIASAKVDDGALREALAQIAALRSPNNGDYVRIAEQALSAPAASAREALPGDVIALVLAGRAIMDGGYVSNVIEEERADANALDKALEAFANRVCYDDEGGIAATHADPCTAGPGRG